jgi:preprotein translocase subunit SecG
LKLNTFLEKLKKKTIEFSAKSEKSNWWRILTIISFIFFLIFLVLNNLENRKTNKKIPQIKWKNTVPLIKGEKTSYRN